MKRIIHELISDLSGRPADETVTFSIDGVAYEIDLTEAEAFKLRNMLQPYVKNGQKAAKTGKTGRVVLGSGSSSRTQQLREVRAWCRDNGYNVPGYGRVPAELWEAYETRTPHPDHVKAQGLEAAAAVAAELSAPKLEETTVVMEPETPTPAPQKAAPARKAAKAAPVKTEIPPAAKTRKAATTSNVVPIKAVKQAPAKKAAPRKAAAQ